MTTEFDQTPRPQPEVLYALTTDDIEDFVRLIPQLSSTPRTAETLTENLQRVIDAPEEEIFVIRDGDGRIQSTTTVSICRIPTGTKAWIDDVVTDEKFRGQGHGQSLMAAAEDWLIESEGLHP